MERQSARRMAVIAVVLKTSDTRNSFMHLHKPIEVGRYVSGDMRG